MQLSNAPLFLCSLLPLSDAGNASEPTARPPAPGPDVGDAALLVPDDVFFTVRIESAEKLLGLARGFTSVSGEDAPEDVQELMADMDVPGDRAQVDPARPAFVAFTLAQMNPLPTIVLPTLDAEAYAASITPEDNLTAVVSGSYVGLSMTANYALRSEPNARVAALRPGLISSHLDLGTLIQTYRPMLEMGLEQVEMMMDQASDLDQGPMDMEMILELYMDGLWAFIDSAQGLDIALDYDGGALALRGDLSTRSKSPMAGFGGGERYDLRQAARWVDPEAGLCVISACDWTLTQEQFGPVIESLIDSYPPELGADLRRYMAAYGETLSLLGPYAAASGDLSPEGMRFTYGLPSPDAAGLAAAFHGALRALAAEPMSSTFKISRPEGVELGGVQALRTHLSFDVGELVAEVNDEQQTDSEELEQLQAMMTALYGANGMDITVGAQAERMVVVLGGDDAYAERGFARGATELEDLPSDLGNAIEAANGGSMAFVYRIDYGQMMAQMAPVMAQFGVPELEAFSDVTGSLPVTVWMSIQGDTWSSGFGLDLQLLAEFMGSIEEPVNEPFIYEIK